jgi:hypothetical protein
VELADPCDTPPALTIKHLYVALLKIIQTSIADIDEQDRTKETLRKVEKSAAGDQGILNNDIFMATVLWLTYMDPHHCPDAYKADEIEVASKLIDWAACTTICREDLDAKIEKLKFLKSENAATVKTLRSGNLSIQWC